MIDPIAGWRIAVPKHDLQPKKTMRGSSGATRRVARKSDLLAFVGLAGLAFAMLTSSVTVALVA
ncbi:MAG TPA: hypothetical protein VJQ81_18755 [Reyranella sp.]|jgi:hypothetical protein|nr:hypothetical protein [Reyranella sp.]